MSEARIPADRATAEPGRTAYSPAARPEQRPKLGYFLLAGVTLFWGINWPATKIGLAEVTVWWFRAMCFFAGAIGLLGIAKLSGASLRMPRDEIPRLLLVSLFAIPASSTL